MGNTFTTLSDAGGRLFEQLYHSFYPGELLLLQGSSTYLLKYLGLAGKVITKDDLKSALEAKLLVWRKDCELGKVKGEAYQIDFTNLVNLVYASVMLETTAAQTDYILGQREFKDRDGKPLFSSMWAGYVDSMISAANMVLSSGQFQKPFVFIDIGSGELKYFQIHPEGDDFNSDGQFSSQDGGEFVQFLEKTLVALTDDSAENVFDPVADVAGFLRRGIEAEVPIHCAASASVRALQQKYPVEMKVLLERLTTQHTILIDILTPEREAIYEWGAVRKALTRAGQLPDGVDGKVLVGNLAWGNGSTQGQNQNKSEVTIVPVGLKTVKKMVTEGNWEGVMISGEKRKEKISFPSESMLLCVVEYLKIRIREEIPDDM